jgi:ribonuclease G
MARELVIASNRHETKLAVLEDDQLVEVYFQRSDEYSLAGSIHKGRVTRVLPGMQSAFVDLGLERDCFLYVSDFFEENEEYDKLADERAPRTERVERAERPEPVAAPAPATAAVAQSAPAPPERPVERQEEMRDRDQRGRRSRRRRNRGQGFPESKYATEIAPRGEAQEAAPAAESPAVVEEFSVLPGESLAKYRRQGGEAVEPPDAGELADVETPPDAGMIPAPEVGTVDAEPVELDEPVAEAVEEVVEPPVPEPAVEESTEAEPAPFEEAPLEEEAEAGTESGVEPETAGEVEPARVPQSLTATLREQGGRFLHRGSRRMRRKVRGGGPPEGEPRETEPRGEPALRPETRQAVRPEKDRPEQPSISELLKEGQEILVQVAKEPLGQKGARITSHIALPGRYCVYMPTVDHMGVSRKIASDEERMRLRRILQAHRAGISGGFIVRTAGEGHTEDEIAKDMSYLYNLWLDIRQKAEKRRAPALIHHDLEIVQRTLRDQLNESFKAIWVDSEEVYESILRYVERFQPALVSRVKMYTRSAPIFDAFNISSELEKALRPKVWLKSGGYIVINQTEALVAIDVNTGKFVGKSNRLEDTIVKTNTEAVREIVRQMRLRDLGGIIVVDFIDMDERKNRQKVMQSLEEAMRSDRAPYKILQFNDFGLVAITRKRVKQSLERTLCSPCPYCEGAGYIKSVPTVVGDIMQEAYKIAKAVAGGSAVLRVNPDVAKLLKSTENRHLEELEEVLGCTVLVTGDPLLHQEKFDLS